MKDKELKRLDEKFRTDSLTPAELKQLRQRMEAEPDSTLSELMEEAWQETSADAGRVDAARLQAIRRRIHARTEGCRIKELRHRRAVLVRWSVAACVAACVALACMLWPEDRPTDVPETWSEYATAANEMRSLLLPDGSRVWLNQTSVLRWLSSGDGSSRRVQLTGEGYFNVARDSLHPFVVEAGQVQVRVLGTRFSLSTSHPDGETLCLEEGSVEMTSLQSGAQVRLKPGDKATLQAATGAIRVEQVAQPRDHIEWLFSSMDFRDEPLRSVLRRMEARYQVRIVLQDEQIGGEQFTGVLSGKSLEDDLKILATACGLQIRQEEDVYKISTERGRR
ncbi:MAG: FecR family protein [Bacteroides sp.]